MFINKILKILLLYSENLFIFIRKIFIFYSFIEKSILFFTYIMNIITTHHSVINYFFSLFVKYINIKL